MRPPAASTAFARPKFVRTSLVSRVPRDSAEERRGRSAAQLRLGRRLRLLLIRKAARLVSDHLDVPCSVIVSPANSRAATVITRINAIWFGTCPSSTSVSLVSSGTGRKGHGAP